MGDADRRSIATRARRTVARDGLDEIVGGLSLGLMALFVFHREHGWALILAAGIQAGLKDIIRPRLTYPRGDFGRMPEAGWVARIFLTVGAIVLAALVGVSLILPLGKGLLALYSGVLLTGVALAAARRKGLIIHYVYAAVFLESGFIGLWLVHLGLDAGRATAFQLWGLAALLIPIGLVRLIRFLSRDPRAIEGVSGERA